MRAKPVVFPPPNCVLKPKQKTTSAVVLYRRPSFSRISVFGTVDRPGWRTSTTCKIEQKVWVCMFVRMSVYVQTLVQVCLYIHYAYVLNAWVQQCFYIHVSIHVCIYLSMSPGVWVFCMVQMRAGLFSDPWFPFPKRLDVTCWINKARMNGGSSPTEYQATQYEAEPKTLVIGKVMEDATLWRGGGGRHLWGWCLCTSKLVKLNICALTFTMLQ